MREGEPRGVQELALEAVARPASPYSGRRRRDGRSPAGARGSGACGRSPARTRSSVSSASARSISKCVTASRGSSVSVDMRVRTRRSRPSGASIVPRAGRRAALDEREVLARDRRARAARPAARAWTASLRATTSSPEVSRSSRCTIPGRSGSSPAGDAARERLRERARRGARAPGARRRRPACRRRAGARPRRRPRTAPAATSAPAPRRASARRVDRSPPASTWRLGRGLAVDGHAPGVDQPLRLRARARRRRRGRRRAARPRASGGSDRGQRRVARVPRARTSSASTPNVIAMSATLNAGQCGSLTKSVTAPARTRSIRLPTAPPSSSPVGSQTSGRSRWRDEERRAARRARRRRRPRRSGPPPANRPNATPVLRTLTSLIPRTRSTSLDRDRSPPRTSALVSLVGDDDAPPRRARRAAPCGAALTGRDQADDERRRRSAARGSRRSG